MGASIGGVAGGVSGYRYAVSNDINPWTGRCNPWQPLEPIGCKGISTLNNNSKSLVPMTGENVFTINTSASENPNFLVEGQNLSIYEPRPNITRYNNSVLGKTDLSHNYPYSFDKIIIQNGEFSLTSQGNYWYISPGSINSTNGWYSIGMYPNGTVFHRCFTNYYPCVK